MKIAEIKKHLQILDHKLRLLIKKEGSTKIAIKSGQAKSDVNDFINSGKTWAIEKQLRIGEKLGL